MGFDAETPLAKATESLTAGRSYGPIVEREGTLIVPRRGSSARVEAGTGQGPMEGEHAGSGSGGGWFGVSWPVGAWIVKGDDVRWVSAIDGTRLAVSILGLAGAMLKIRAKRKPG